MAAGSEPGLARMRILIASNHRYPSYGVVGSGRHPMDFPSGSAGYVQDLLARGLAELGHEVFYFLRRGSETPLPQGVQLVSEPWPTSISIKPPRCPTRTSMPGNSANAAVIPGCCPATSSVRSGRGNGGRQLDLRCARPRAHLRQGPIRPEWYRSGGLLVLGDERGFRPVHGKRRKRSHERT